MKKQDTLKDLLSRGFGIKGQAADDLLRRVHETNKKQAATAAKVAANGGIKFKED